MVVNIVGYGKVSGKRKSDGQEWSACVIYYVADTLNQKIVGKITGNEFINNKFYDVLAKSGLGQYDLVYGKGFNGKAFVDGVNFIK